MCYTWNIKLYCGKEQDAGASVPTNVVELTTLSEKLLNARRLAITDNYYTSIELANKLLDKKTHLLGTLRANRRGNPKEVTTKKLKVIFINNFFLHCARYCNYWIVGCLPLRRIQKYDN
jgi:hypothetical protein